MKKILFLLGIVPLICQAEVNIDSLITTWNNENLSDSIRLRALNELVWSAYLFSQPDSAFYYAQQGVEYTKEKGLEKDLAILLNKQGISFAVRTDYDNALNYYQQSLDIKHKLNEEALKANTINNMAVIYMKQGNYSTALEYYNKSLTLSERYNDLPGIARSNQNIALIYSRLEEYDKALEYNTKSLSIYKELHDKPGISGCYNNIGVIFLRLKKYDTALSYYYKALAIEEERENELGIAYAFCNIGIIQGLQENYASALGYQQRSLVIKEKIGDKDGIAGSLSNMGEIYYRTGKQDSAIIFGRRALEIAQLSGNTENIASAAKVLHLAYRKKKDFKKSLEMHELHYEMEDSLLSEKKQNEIIHQEYKFKYEQKRFADSLKNAKAAEIETLVRQKEIVKEKIKQYVLYGLFIIFIITIGIVFRIRSIKIKTQKEYLLREIQILKSVAVIQMASSKESVLHNQLNKEKIDHAFNGALNDSDWRILSLLCENPSINNREISERISLSFDGVRSSLKKMYRIFNIQNTKENQRIALVIQAIRISETF